MAELGRRLGLDVGDVRIGVAMSDPMGIVATPLETLQATNIAADAEAVAELIREHGIVCVVVGMPLNAKGEQGHQAKKTLAFIDALHTRTEVEIATIDERFTSAVANRVLNDAKVRGKRRKNARKSGLVDQIAAQQILQTYLDRNARS